MWAPAAGDFYREAMELIRRPAVAEVAIDVLLCAVPIWVAVTIGLFIGWSWRPRWTSFLFLGLRARIRFLLAALPAGLAARRLCLAFTALSAFSIAHRLRGRKPPSTAANRDGADRNCTIPDARESTVTENDLERLLHLLESKDIDTDWENLMERATTNMTYQAWRRDPEAGPVIYCSRTIFEDATPELVRDFFWDDDFRLKWDAMLVHYKVLEEFPQDGTMIVHWIKKFPFFCSDREYIICRRIWESGRTFFCVTKGVPYPSLCKRDKPRRVELYFSSWRIRAVESLKQEGQLSACEVTLIHYEDMGIPKDLAKVGVRHLMWSAVKKLQFGFRAYQQMRKTETNLSRSALMARITTKMLSNDAAGSSDPHVSNIEGDENKKRGDLRLRFDWKWIAVAGAVAAAGVLPIGVVGKVAVLGAMRRQVKNNM